MSQVQRISKQIISENQTSRKRILNHGHYKEYLKPFRKTDDLKIAIISQVVMHLFLPGALE